VVSRSPLVVIDGAHNPEGAQALATTVREEFDIPGRLVMVIGMLEGRDVVEMLRCLSVTDADLVIATRPPSPRAVPAEDVAAVARAMGALVEQVDDVASAVGRALDVSTSEDAVVVAGSLYVVGAARTALHRMLPAEE
jgi:dihydrofolate synthase/folylpolyglutamate synthase